MNLVSERSESVAYQFLGANTKRNWWKSASERETTCKRNDNTFTVKAPLCFSSVLFLFAIHVFHELLKCGFQKASPKLDIRALWRSSVSIVPEHLLYTWSASLTRRWRRSLSPWSCPQASDRTVPPAVVPATPTPVPAQAREFRTIQFPNALSEFVWH